MTRPRSAACAGLLYALDWGARAILTGDTRVLVIAADIRSRFVDPDDLPQPLAPLLRTGKAVCGVLRGEELKALFQDQAEQVRSAAVVPLEHNGRLGILAIGSRDAMHFRSSMGTLFITHIGQVLSRRLVDVSRPASPRQAQRA